MGETITTDYVNYNGNYTYDYDGNYTYGKAPKGKYRQQTTPVNQFFPNGFGLYDMHGNVWEWCDDGWHKNYENAPNDGSSWNDNHSQSGGRVIRGGSWIEYPRYCRSAYRDKLSYCTVNDGFRVVFHQDS